MTAHSIYSIIFKENNVVISRKIELYEDTPDHIDIPFIEYKNTITGTENDDLGYRKKTVHDYYAIPKGETVDKVRISHEFIQFKVLPLNKAFGTDRFIMLETPQDKERNLYTALVLK